MMRTTSTTMSSLSAADFLPSKRIPEEMGWVCTIESEASNTSDEFARKICVDDAHLHDVQCHGYYREEMPTDLCFVSEDEEIAYYDKLQEKDFIGEVETRGLFERWRNL